MLHVSNYSVQRPTPRYGLPRALASDPRSDDLHSSRDAALGHSTHAVNASAAAFVPDDVDIRPGKPSMESTGATAPIRRWLPSKPAPGQVGQHCRAMARDCLIHRTSRRRRHAERDTRGLRQSGQSAAVAGHSGRPAWCARLFDCRSSSGTATGDARTSRRYRRSDVRKRDIPNARIDVAARPVGQDQGHRVLDGRERSRCPDRPRQIAHQYRAASTVSTAPREVP